MNLLTGKVNIKNMNNYMTITNNSSLTNEPIDLLYKCARNHFQFGEYNSLDILLSKLGVEVHIEPGIRTRQIPTSLDEAINHWDKISKEEYAKRRKGLSTPERYFEIEKKHGELKKERGDILNMPLRGEYDPTNNVIILYPEEMMQEYEGQCMDKLLVSTLVHEAMHAYFNRPGHETFPYIYYVEEPLAEFGMLLYLHETQSQDLYEWAYDDVKSKTTCYKYGANLMDQYLSETKQGMPSPTRKYLEAYKINIGKFDIPDYNSAPIVLPGGHTPIIVKGQSVPSIWQDVFKYPPRYFYDPNTKTLGLDGDWREERRGYFDIDLFIHIDTHIHIMSSEIENIYLGDNFIADNHHMHYILSEADVDVSPKNSTFYAQNGIPLLKGNNKPFLKECGDGFYALSRKNKWGVIDDKLNLIVPYKYNYIWDFDDNDLLLVRNDNLKYGRVNKQGKEQVPVKYDDIDINDDGTYTVEDNGVKSKIDKYGNSI